MFTGCPRRDPARLGTALTALYHAAEVRPNAHPCRDAAMGRVNYGLGNCGRSRLVGFLGLFAFDQRFNWADQHMSVAALHPRHAFHRAVSAKIGAEAHEELLAEVGVGNFTAAKLYDRLHAIAFLEKADGVVFLEI